MRPRNDTCLSAIVGGGGEGGMWGGALMQLPRRGSRMARGGQRADPEITHHGQYRRAVMRHNNTGLGLNICVVANALDQIPMTPALH